MYINTNTSSLHGEKIIGFCLELGVAKLRYSVFVAIDPTPYGDYRYNQS